MQHIYTTKQYLKATPKKSTQKKIVAKMTVPTLDNLPRVPDTHGDNVDERMFSDLYIRTSLVDANVALEQIGAVSETIPFQIISTLRLLFIIVIRGKHICCARSFDVHIFLAVVDLYRELALN